MPLFKEKTKNLSKMYKRHILFQNVLNIYLKYWTNKEFLT